MKFHWGTGIFIFLIIFFIAIFSFMYFAFTNESDLVENDYYPKEIEYQKQIEKMKNLKTLGEEVSFYLENNHIVIRFPLSQKGEHIKGDILIYRPSDEKFDKKIDIDISKNNSQIISIDNLPKGKYILKIDWEYDGTLFYQELTLIL